MSATTYVFMNKYEKYQYFVVEKSTLSRFMSVCLKYVAMLNKTYRVGVQAGCESYLWDEIWVSHGEYCYYIQTPGKMSILQTDNFLFSTKTYIMDMRTMADLELWGVGVVCVCVWGGGGGGGAVEPP